MTFDTQIGTDITTAKVWLTQGELIGLPTETVYGLAGNALDPAIVVKIYQAKNRPYFDPLIVHTHSMKAIEALVTHIPDRLRLLMETFMPGPLTVLLPRLPIIPDLVTSGMERVAVRIPAHPIALEVLRQLPFPLAAPSANPFGYISPTTAQHVYEGLGGQLPYILDGGACAVGLESTIVAEEDGQIVVYRLGGISIEQIEAVIGNVIVKKSTNIASTTPGTLLSHYAPTKPLYLGDIDKLLTTHHDRKFGILSFQKAYPLDTSITYSPSGDIGKAAQHLFAAMRALDHSSIDIILAERLPDEGLGRAINDRLERASCKRG